MPDIRLKLNEFHPKQNEIWANRTRRNVGRLGRRFGKTQMIVKIASNAAAHGLRAAICAPEHKQVFEPYEEILSALGPIKRRASEQHGTIRTINGGVVDFWSLIDNPLACRGRDYDVALIDEASFTKFPQMMDIWEKSIEPTLLIPKGAAWVFGTPIGDSPDNFLWQLCNNKKLGFKEFYGTSKDNPLVDPNWLEMKRETTRPDVFAQEYLAQFINWTGSALFPEKDLLVDGRPVPWPAKCDFIAAVVDTALKDGLEHDGTAVMYFAVNLFHGTPLTILDYDAIQIRGDLLDEWLPSVDRRCQELAVACGARRGSGGIWIEDKASGIVLLPQGVKRGINVHPIDSVLTSLGKEQRALNVSGYVYQGKVKFSEFAHNKSIVFKETERNHMVTQICGFRVGAKMPNDDILDTFLYGLAIILGDSQGT